MAGLKLKSGKAELKTVRPKREGGEKGRITAMFLTFAGLANATNLKSIFNTNAPPDFWEEDKRKPVLFPYLSEIKSSIEYGDAKVTFGSLVLTGCKVSKFTMQPQEGRFMLVELVVKCYPVVKQVGEITDMMGEIGELSIDANTLLDNTDDDGEEGEEQEDLLSEK